MHAFRSGSVGALARGFRVQHGFGNLRELGIRCFLFLQRLLNYVETVFLGEFYRGFGIAGVGRIAVMKGRERDDGNEWATPATDSCRITG